MIDFSLHNYTEESIMFTKIFRMQLCSIYQQSASVAASSAVTTVLSSKCYVA